MTTAGTPAREFRQKKLCVQWGWGRSEWIEQAQHSCMAGSYKHVCVCVAWGKIDTCRRCQQTGFKRKKKLLKGSSQVPGVMSLGLHTWVAGGRQGKDTGDRGWALHFLLTLKFTSPFWQIREQSGCLGGGAVPSPLLVRGQFGEGGPSKEESGTLSSLSTYRWKASFC